MTENRAIFLDSILLCLRNDGIIDYEITFDSDEQRVSELTYLTNRLFIQPLAMHFEDELLRFEITRRGTEFYANGGFQSEYRNEQNIIFDRYLERKSKKWAIINSKWSLAISILAFVLSIIALFKDEIMGIFLKK